MRGSVPGTCPRRHRTLRCAAAREERPESVPQFPYVSNREERNRASAHVQSRSLNVCTTRQHERGSGRPCSSPGQLTFPRSPELPAWKQRASEPTLRGGLLTGAMFPQFWFGRCLVGVACVALMSCNVKMQRVPCNSHRHRRGCPHVVRGSVGS